MFENNLAGTLPFELTLLGTLQEIKLGGSADLEGTIPPDLFSGLNLTSIGIRSSQVSGVIPTQIGMARRLNKIYLLANQHTWTMPSASLRGNWHD